MWNAAGLFFFQWCIIMPTIITAHNVHSIYKMGQTSWGRMTQREFCPKSTHVVGFRLQVKVKMGLFKDDSALNGIQLKCADGSTTGKLEGPRGSWGTFRQCTGGRHVTGFNLRSEGNQGGLDDAAATDVEMQCSDKKEVLYGDGIKWGSWHLKRGYQECPAASYFCGVQARIEGVNSDTTGLNEMVFICCHIVHGGWGDWSPWTTCPTPCGTGTTHRTRECNKPSPMEGGDLCVAKDGTYKEIEREEMSCANEKCGVDGGWGGWSSWSECSVTCGAKGKQTRGRKCDDPSPTTGGADCIMSNGKTSKSEGEVKECSRGPCLTPTPITPPTAPPTPVTLIRNEDGSTSFAVKLVAMDTDIRHYDVIVAELGVTGEFPRADPSTYTNSEVASNVDGLYVAGRVFGHNAAGKTFIVGGKGNSENRGRRSLAEPSNKRLQEGAVYGAFVRGYITEDNFVTSHWLPPVRISKSPVVGASVQESESSPVGVTIGVVLVIGAILFTAFAFLLWRRRRNTHHKQTRNTREMNAPTTAEGSVNEGTGYQYEVMSDTLRHIPPETSAHAQYASVEDPSLNKPPIYDDIVRWDSTRFPEPPPAYAEIGISAMTSSTSTMASSTPVYQTPLSTGNKLTVDLPNVEPHQYNELNANRAPSTNTTPVPGYDSLNHTPEHNNNKNSDSNNNNNNNNNNYYNNNNTAYNRLNVNNHSEPINSQQQGYDQLTNMSSASSSSASAAQTDHGTSQSGIQPTYENGGEAGMNIYEDLNTGSSGTGAYEDLNAV